MLEHRNCADHSLSFFFVCHSLFCHSHTIDEKLNDDTSSVGQCSKAIQNPLCNLLKRNKV